MAPTVTPADGNRSRRPYHARMLAAFVQHTRIEDVANAAGVSVRTTQRWRSDWSIEIEAARADVLKDTLARLRNSLPLIADGIVAVALDKEQPASVRVRAATAVFDTFNNLSQRAELDQRLTAIEAALRDQARPPNGRSA